LQIEVRRIRREDILAKSKNNNITREVNDQPCRQPEHRRIFQVKDIQFSEYAVKIFQYEKEKEESFYKSLFPIESLQLTRDDFEKGIAGKTGGEERDDPGRSAVVQFMPVHSCEQAKFHWYIEYDQEQIGQLEEDEHS